MGAVASRYRVYNSGLAPTDIKKLENENKRENPGTLDELHKKTKGTKQISPTEAFPVLLGDVDPSGNVNFNLIHQLTPEIRLKGAAQLTATQGTLEYKGSDYTLALAVGKPDFSDKSAVFVGHYLQSVTKRLSLGAELVYQVAARMAGGEIAIASAAGRYTMDVLEKKLQPLPFTFALSGMANQAKQQFKFGCGLIIG
ncbi:hypothetical protein MSG28_011604 [Choristoneura fumiferana]|uniref:Uncharacterized protein n=1 Tax=Choristoneura fumiferana TaxID=7141 RepID=A0ACC0JNZ1_CHOFU|nr:hypothetical protein MSG28_011604 [Choristoneura fumiferana]